MELNPDLLREYMREGIDHAPDAIYWIDRDGRFVYANSTATKYLGYSREELTAMSVPDINPAVSEKSWPDIWGLVGDRESVTFDSEHRRKDGSLMPVEVTARSIEVDGQPLVFAFVRDESDRYLAETKLKQSQQRLQSILDHTSAVIFIKDLEGRYLLVNQRYLDLFSIKQEGDIVGRTDLEIFDEALAKAFREADRQVLESGERIEVEEVAPHQDGLHTYISTKFPLRDESGEIFGIGGIATDITPRKRAMEQAADQAERIRRLYEVASIPALSFDARIDETLAAGCELLGMETAVVGEIDGETLRVRNIRSPDRLLEPGDELSQGESCCSLPCRKGNLVATENFSQSEFRDNADHERLGLEAYIGTPIDLGGEVFGTLCFWAREPRTQPFESPDCDFVQLMGRWVATMIDAAAAAERERSYAAELKRSNRDLEEFAYVASHDLKEPLRTVSSFATLFERKFEKQIDDEADEFIHHMTGATRRMQRLIDDLLQYSRIGIQGKALKEVSLEQVTDEVLKNLAAVIAGAKAEVSRESLPKVTGDYGQLVQLFQNLIENAIKFCVDGPARIEISSRRLENSWKIEVRDNGPGIPAEHHEGIFRIFQHHHGSEEFEGSGIGLAICRRIVQRHGGEIRVESVPGEGCAFFFTLSPAAG